MRGFVALLAAALAFMLRPFHIDLPEETVRRHARLLQFIFFTLPVAAWIPLAAALGALIIDRSSSAGIMPLGLDPQDYPFQLIVLLVLVVVCFPLCFVVVGAVAKAVYLICRALGGFRLAP
jgi:hypothetical protein